MSKIFTPLGASNHTKQIREINDFYATSPEAVTHLIEGEAVRKLPINSPVTFS